jgi:hypothetical protein
VISYFYMKNYWSDTTTPPVGYRVPKPPPPNTYAPPQDYCSMVYFYGTKTIDGQIGIDHVWGTRGVSPYGPKGQPNPIAPENFYWDKTNIITLFDARTPNTPPGPTVCPNGYITVFQCAEKPGGYNAFQLFWNGPPPAPLSSAPAIPDPTPMSPNAPLYPATTFPCWMKMGYVCQTIKDDSCPAWMTCTNPGRYGTCPPNTTQLYGAHTFRKSSTDPDGNYMCKRWQGYTYWMSGILTTNPGQINNTWWGTKYPAGCAPDQSKTNFVTPAPFDTL